jgi:hypothetical protein
MAHRMLHCANSSRLVSQRAPKSWRFQTLRNSFDVSDQPEGASTAVLGLMGTVTLAAPSLHVGFDDVLALPAPRLVHRVAVTHLAVRLAGLLGDGGRYRTPRLHQPGMRWSRSAGLGHLPARLMCAARGLLYYS